MRNTQDIYSAHVSSFLTKNQVGADAAVNDSMSCFIIVKEKTSAGSFNVR